MLAPIEETIERVEKLYQTLTGREAPRSNGEPYAPIPPEADATRHVEEGLVRLVESLQSTFGAVQRPSWQPLLTLREERDEYVLELDVPGVSRDSLSVVVAGDVVTVAGHRKRPEAADPVGERLVHSEQVFGSFERSISLPGGIPAEEIRAELTDGVLTIRAPRSAGPEAEPREIPVT